MESVSALPPFLFMITCYWTCFGSLFVLNLHVKVSISIWDKNTNCLNVELFDSWEVKGPIQM